MKVHHLNCGILHAPPYPPAACHCLLLEGGGRLALIDTGIGLQDVARPLERIGQTLIELAGFQFHEEFTAARQIERLGFQTVDVSDIVLTHADPDHTGGLADFPEAAVHVAHEEQARVESGHGRYLPIHFAHGPHWVSHRSAPERWYGMEARRISLAIGADVLAIPLFGHTLGHCGVAVAHAGRWILHVGDAYYLRAELEADDHPVTALASQRADDDALRRASLAALRRLTREYPAEIDVFGYHDFTEFPSDAGVTARMT